MLTDELEWCELLVDYCDVFISCLDSHSDGTHSLQSIHCWASDEMWHFSKSVPMKKHLPFGWPEGKDIFSKFSFLGWTFLLSTEHSLNLNTHQTEVCTWIYRPGTHTHTHTHTHWHPWHTQKINLKRQAAQSDFTLTFFLLLRCICSKMLWHTPYTNTCSDQSG